MRDRRLWQRLLAFRIDDPAAEFTFCDRLGREQGWDPRFTARVVDEYRRFVYLAMTADHHVTPSREVDEAWHLHLCYTRSYWHELCRDVLGRELHHGPTKGGVAEAARYDEQYRQTLDSYRREFGEAPPADVWPPPAVRFGRAPRRRGGRSQRSRRRAMLAALALVMLATAGCHPAADNWAGLVMLCFGVIGMVVLVVHLIASVRQAALARERGDHGGCADAGGCSGGSYHGHDEGGSDGGADGCGGGCGGGCGD